MAADKQYLNQTEASRVYGCTAKAIRDAMEPGKGLYDATVKHDGRRYIDMGTRAAKAYRKDKRVKNPRISTPKRSAPSPGNVESPGIEEDVRAYLGWTLADIINKFGTMPLFASLLTAGEKIEKINSMRMDADKRTGELISRAYVRTHVMSLIERVFQQLLTDAPTTMALEVHGRCSTGATVEEVHEILQAGISRELRTIKRDTTKAIKNATD